MNMRLVIDVDFKRTTSSSVMEEMNVKVPDEMPVYSADVKLTNITWSSTGDYVLFVNNSYGYISYDFFVNVYKPDEGTILQFDSNITGRNFNSKSALNSDLFNLPTRRFYTIVVGVDSTASSLQLLLM